MNKRTCSRFRHTLFLLILFVSIFQDSAWPEERRPGPLERGVEALQKGDIRTAEAEFLEVTKTDPGNPFANLHLGTIFLATGRINLALAALNRAIASKPDLVQAHLRLADIYEGQGNLPEAIRAVQKAYRSLADETSPEGKAISGRLEGLRGRLKIKETFDRGITLLRKGDVEAAVEAFRNVLAIQAQNVQARHFLGIALGIQNRIDEAIEQFEELLRIKPDAIDSRTRLAELYQVKGRLTDARSEFEKSLFFLEEKDGPVAQSLEEKLNAVEDQIALKGLLDRSNKEIEDKKIDAAITTLQAVFRIDPNHALAYFNLGNLWAQKNRFDLAERHFKKAIEIAPNYTEAYQRLGQVYELMRFFGRAKTRYQEGLETPGGKSDQMRERLEGLIGRNEQAMQQVKSAAQEALRASQQMLGEGDSDKAVSFLERAVFLNPEDPRLHFLLGELYEQKDKMDQASNQMRGALEFDPEFAEARQHLGRLHEKRGYFYQAAKEWKKAAAIRPSELNKEELDRLARKLTEIEDVTAPLMKRARREADRGRRTAAIKSLNEALVSAPDDIRIRLMLGPLYAKTGDVTAAFREFNSVLLLDPENEEAKYGLGRLYSSAGQWRDAERTFREMLRGEDLSKMFRNKAEIEWARAVEKVKEERAAERYLQRGNHFLSAQDYPAAIEAFEKVLRIFPSHVLSLYRTGLAYENLGASKKAVPYYKKILTVDPRHTQARQRLGFIYEGEGEIERAIRMYRETLSLFKGDDSPQAVWVKNRLTPLEKRFFVTFNHVILSYNSNPAGSSDPEGDISSNLGIDLSYYLKKDRRLQIPIGVGTHNTFFFESNTYFSSETVSLSATGLRSPYSYSIGYRLRFGLAKGGTTGTDHIGHISLVWRGVKPSTLGLEYSYNKFLSSGREDFDADRQTVRLSLTQRWGANSAGLSVRFFDNDANLNDQASRTHGIELSYNRDFSEKVRGRASYGFDQIEFVNLDSLAKRRRRNLFHRLTVSVSYFLQKNFIFGVSYTEQRNSSNLPSGAVTVEQRLSGQAASLGDFEQRLISLNFNWSF
ncbi:MAG: tetratricopeptide repeat protein [Nitrospiria bacterium]